MHRHDLRREITRQRQQRAADNTALDRHEAMQRQAELRLRQRQEMARRRAEGRLYPRTYQHDRFGWYHDGRYIPDRPYQLNGRYHTWYWGTIPPRHRAPYRHLDLYYGGRRYRAGDTWYYTPPYVLHPRYYRHEGLWDYRHRYPLYLRHGHRYPASRSGFCIDLRF